MTGGRSIQGKRNVESSTGAFSISVDLYKANTYHKIMYFFRHSKQVLLYSSTAS